jgi:hypothetical protein
MSPMSHALKECGIYIMVREFITATYWSKSHKTHGARLEASERAIKVYNSLPDDQKIIAGKCLAILRVGYPRKGF